MSPSPNISETLMGKTIGPGLKRLPHENFISDFVSLSVCDAVRVKRLQGQVASSTQNPSPIPSLVIPLVPSFFSQISHSSESPSSFPRCRSQPSTALHRELAGKCSGQIGLTPQDPRMGHLTHRCTSGSSVSPQNDL